MIKIKIINSVEKSPKLLKLIQSTILCGRDPTNHIQLDDSKVSRCHFEIRKRNNSTFVYDNESSNGTYVNGKLIKRLSEKEIKLNDIITIGNFHIQIVDISYDNLDSISSTNSDNDCEPTLDDNSCFKGFYEDEQKYFNDTEILTIKAKILQQLQDEIDLRRLKVQMDISEKMKIEYECKSIVQRIIMKDLGREISRLNLNKDYIIKDVLDESLRYGPLQDLIEDNNSGITEIMLTPDNKIFVEIDGKIRLSYRKFRNKESIKGVIYRFLRPSGRRVDEASPLVDCRLPCGSRVHIALLVDGANITIRKFPSKSFSIHDLVKYKTLSYEMSRFLELCVVHKKNIIVAGGTGTGKTQTLNVLSSFIPNDQRVITIEDTLELQLEVPHIVRMEARPPNNEGIGEITIQELFRNSLRMRGDRVIIGECRGSETADVLQSGSSGHSGTMTTAHSNNPKDLMLRLENMASLSGLDLPGRTIRQQIASAFDIVIQQNRINGRRIITQISEIIGFEDNEIIIRDLFLYKRNSSGGFFIATGFIPNFILDLIESDVPVDMNMFQSNQIFN